MFCDVGYNGLMLHLRRIAPSEIAGKRSNVRQLRGIARIHYFNLISASQQCYKSLAKNVDQILSLLNRARRVLVLPSRFYNQLNVCAIK